MAHEFDSGFFVRKPAWHGLGNVIADYPGSWEEAREAAGLGWDPIKVPAYTLAGIDEVGNPRFEEIEGWKSVVRSDDQSTLAMVRDTYHVINHKEIGEIVESLLEQDNIKYETAGSLKGGKKVWALMKLDTPLNIAKDPSQTFSYVLVSTSHDSSAALQALSTNVRVVCANTLRLAEVEATKYNTAFRFTHNASWSNRMDEAKLALRGVREESVKYAELATRLLGMKVTAKGSRVFIDEFLPLPTTEASDKVIESVKLARLKMDGILKSETCVGINHTAYGLVQASVEYLDWFRRSNSDENRFERSVYNASTEKVGAAKLALAVANI